MLKKLLTIGLHAEMPTHKQRRVKAANLITLIVLGTLAVPFTVLSWIYYPPIAWLPLLGVVVGLAYYVLTAAGRTQLARFILVVGPALLVCFYNTNLSGPDGEPLTTLTFISMVFIIMAFVVVDTREKGLLALSIFSAGMPILLLPVAKQWITLDPDHTAARLAYVALLETGWMSHVSYLMGIMVASGAMLGLSQIGRSAEQESETARQEAEQKSQAVQQEKRVADEALLKLKEAQHGEDQRRWATEGIAQLTHLTRAQTDDQVNTLYDRVITHFVKYLEANQGGLYIVNREADVEIRLEACYAYERKKYRQKTIAPGEGLVGQVFLERQAMRLDELPADYVNITSGLGKATPQSLAIVPLMVNDQVEGLLEIASFRVMEDHHLRFLEKAGETLAAFIQMNRINTKTRILLAEAQQQAEEMRAQEEEMRQNLEELAATQEEMHRKEQAYQTKIAQLENQQAAT